jgi:hypothetical protein
LHIARPVGCYRQNILSDFDARRVSCTQRKGRPEAKTGGSAGAVQNDSGELGTLKVASGLRAKSAHRNRDLAALRQTLRGGVRDIARLLVVQARDQVADGRLSIRKLRT